MLKIILDNIVTMCYDSQTMKKILIVLAFCLLNSCASLMPPAESSTFTMPDGIYNPVQAWMWVSEHIYYRSDASNYYHIQTPQETLNKGWGDCKAYSVLLAAMIYELGNKNVWIVYGYKTNGVYHAIVAAPLFTNYQGSDEIEPQAYGVYYTDNFREDSRMSYATYKMLIDGGWQSY
jgi:hypothetical protein